MLGGGAWCLISSPGSSGTCQHTPEPRRTPEQPLALSNTTCFSLETNYQTLGGGGIVLIALN